MISHHKEVTGRVVPNAVDVSYPKSGRFVPNQRIVRTPPDDVSYPAGKRFVPNQWTFCIQEADVLYPIR